MQLHRRAGGRGATARFVLRLLTAVMFVEQLPMPLLALAPVRAVRQVMVLVELGMQAPLHGLCGACVRVVCLCWLFRVAGGRETRTRGNRKVGLRGRDPAHRELQLVQPSHRGAPAPGLGRRHLRRRRPRLVPLRTAPPLGPPVRRALAVAATGFHGVALHVLRRWGTRAGRVLAFLGTAAALGACFQRMFALELAGPLLGEGWRVTMRFGAPRRGTV